MSMPLWNECVASCSPRDWLSQATFYSEEKYQNTTGQGKRALQCTKVKVSCCSANSKTRSTRRRLNVQGNCPTCQKRSDRLTGVVQCIF